jgi:hypothetical protein
LAIDWSYCPVSIYHLGSPLMSFFFFFPGTTTTSSWSNRQGTERVSNAAMIREIALRTTVSSPDSSFVMMYLESWCTDLLILVFFLRRLYRHGWLPSSYSRKLLHLRLGLDRVNASCASWCRGYRVSYPSTNFPTLRSSLISSSFLHMPIHPDDNITTCYGHFMNHGHSFT